MKWGIQNYIPSPWQIATVILDDPSDEDSNSNGTPSSHAEIMDSEEMAAESKESEDNEIKWSEQRDMTKCEFLVNLQVWHTKLVDELYPKEKQHRKKSSGLKKMFKK